MVDTATAQQDLRRDADAADLRRPIGARAVRDFGDGFVAVLLPAYLLALDFSAFQVGLFATVALLGSAALTLGIGLFLINMFMLWLTAVVVPGFDASGFWQIAKAAIVIWLTNMLLSGLWPDDDRRGRVTAVWVRQG